MTPGERELYAAAFASCHVQGQPISECLVAAWRALSAARDARVALLQRGPGLLELHAGGPEQGQHCAHTLGEFLDG